MIQCTYMEIPLWILLIPFAIIVACTAIFLFFNVFHLKRYGITGHGATSLMMLYLGSYAIILITGMTILGSINWQQKVHLNDIIPFAGKGTASFGL